MNRSGAGRSGVEAIVARDWLISGALWGRKVGEVETFCLQHSVGVLVWPHCFEVLRHRRGR